MRYKLVAVLALVAGIVFSCSKNESSSGDGVPNQPLIDDGSMSPQLGKRINLSQYGGIKFYGTQWGRDRNELFVSTATGLLKINLASATVKVFEKDGGHITGKTVENSAIVFLGNIRNTMSYYLFDLSTDSIKQLFTVANDQATKLDIGGDHMFFYTGMVGPPSNPCTSPWDLWCSNSSSIVNSSFYYINKNTHETIHLPGNRFLLFSITARKAILSGSSGFSNYIYIFDCGLRSVVDSIETNLTDRPAFLDSSLRYVERGGTGLEDLLIVDAFTGQVLHQFTPTAKFIDTRVYLKWSEDGTKLYYMGGAGLNSGAMVINVYDLATKKEKNILSFSLLAGGSIPIDSDFRLSSDNRRLVIRYLNELYIKDVE